MRFLATFLLCTIGFYSAGLADGIIIDHHCVDVARIPPAYVAAAKSQFRVYYGHTSHGSQITSGMKAMRSPLFNFNRNGEDDALSYWEVGGDLGSRGSLAWASTTREQLNSEGNDRNLVMWSWCGGVSSNTVEGIDAYLNEMNALEKQYPGVLFVYMTGHLDGSGVDGNLHQRNEQIRAYCRENDKILFDFADIESYTPDGLSVLPMQANDNCDYYDGKEWRNWAEDWCQAHPEQCSTCKCAHSQSLNCDRKARAFWWMMARLAGWDGEDAASAIPVSTPSANGISEDDMANDAS
ncbi:MAG: hypothetical protein PWP23_2721 [Candidatus Sumerlaeota bacterium]|nr:hypothetical protein [Candidatus Sumerlaeota bacterium]